MNAKLALQVSVLALDELIKKKVNTLKINGAEIPVGYCRAAVEDLINFVYPEIETDRLHKMIRCKDCVHYKKLIHKTNPRLKKWVCDLNREPRHKDWYCADAIERS